MFEVANSSSDSLGGLPWKRKQKCRAQGQPLSWGFFPPRCSMTSWAISIYPLIFSLMLISWAVNAKPILLLPLLLLAWSSPHLGPQWRAHRGPPGPVSVTAHPVTAPTHLPSVKPSNAPLPKKLSRPLSCTCQEEIRSPVPARGGEGHRIGLWVKWRWTCRDGYSGGRKLWDCNTYLLLNCAFNAEVIWSLF